MARRDSGVMVSGTPIRVAGFNTARYRLSLDDELDAKRMASEAFQRRRSRADRDLMVVRHMVRQERAEREETERVVREARERREREAAEKEAEKETIHGLPEELMLSIFKLLELEDLALSVVPVCSRWRRLGRDESLWASATLRYDALAESNFIRTLLTAPTLGCLEVFSHHGAPPAPVAKALTKGCKQVRSLRMLPCIPETLLWAVLDRMAESLEHLELFVTDLGVLACIGSMDNLRGLVLHGEISFVSDKMLRLGSGCPQLTELDMGGLRFLDIHRLDGLVADVVRGHADTLSVLRLPPNMTSATVLEAVALCSQLKKLAIWITPHITSSLLAAALQDLEQLESLTWRNYDAWLDKAELAHFILKSDRFRCLRDFRLLDCIDMDDGLALAIAHRAQGLLGLSLHRSELSARGLAEILGSARSLTSLDLYKNATVSVEHLDLVAANLRELRYLDLRGCYALRTLDQDIWHHLLDQLPQLDIRFD